MAAKKTWWFVFLLALSPSIYLLSLYFFNPRFLGVDSTEVLLEEMGEWAIRFVILSLACSPIKRIGFKKVLKFRRMLGLYAFYYGSLHLITYLFGWIELDWLAFKEELLDRPFIYLGMIGWCILLLLAITSFKRVVKALRKKWVLIHKLIYPLAGIVWVHLLMQARSSLAEAVLYGFIISILLLERVYRNLSKYRLAKRVV